MSDFKQSLPRQNPFKCDVTRHLWRYGLALAIYQKVGQITNGGQRTFHADTAPLAEFFGANKAYVRRMFAVLDRAGFLVVVRNEDTRKAVKKDRAKKIRRWISHEEWAKSHDGECVKVDERLMPWSADADPLCGKLWSVFEGKIRIYEALLTYARSCGRSDDEIEDAMSQAWQAAKARKARGEYEGTGVKAVFSATVRALRGNESKSYQDRESKIDEMLRKAEQEFQARKGG
jgi:hypothetical protein